MVFDGAIARQTADDRGQPATSAACSTRPGSSTASASTGAAGWSRRWPRRVAPVVGEQPGRALRGASLIGYLLVAPVLFLLLRRRFPPGLSAGAGGGLHARAAGVQVVARHAGGLVGPDARGARAAGGRARQGPGPALAGCSGSSAIAALSITRDATAILLPAVAWLLFVERRDREAAPHQPRAARHRHGRGAARVPDRRHAGPGQPRLRDRRLQHPRRQQLELRRQRLPGPALAHDQRRPHLSARLHRAPLARCCTSGWRSPRRRWWRSRLHPSRRRSVLLADEGRHPRLHRCCCCSRTTRRPTGSSWCSCPMAAIGLAILGRRMRRACTSGCRARRYPRLTRMNSERAQAYGRLMQAVRAEGPEALDAAEQTTDPRGGRRPAVLRGPVLGRRGPRRGHARGRPRRRSGRLRALGARPRRADAARHRVLRADGCRSLARADRRAGRHRAALRGARRRAPAAAGAGHPGDRERLGRAGRAARRASRRVIAYDNRGSGASTVTAGALHCAAASRRRRRRCSTRSRSSARTCSGCRSAG